MTKLDKSIARMEEHDRTIWCRILAREQAVIELLNDLHHPAGKKAFYFDFKEQTSRRIRKIRKILEGKAEGEGKIAPAQSNKQEESAQEGHSEAQD